MSTPAKAYNPTGYEPAPDPDAAEEELANMQLALDYMEGEKRDAEKAADELHEENELLRQRLASNSARRRRLRFSVHPA